MVLNNFTRIKSALKSSAFVQKLSSIFAGKAIDKQLLENLEDMLISSDFGFETAHEIIESLKSEIQSSNLKEAQLNLESIKLKLEELLTKVLEGSEATIALKENLNIIVLCGINGAGKTTSIGKLASLFKSQNNKVVIGACDSFRAAAKEQVKEWGVRAGVEVIDGEGDPASIAYKTVEYAQNNNSDVVLIDTAGRLQSQANLMDELKKIIKVIGQKESSAPHHTILVLDGTIGQNALSQVEEFSKAVPITGLIVTKLDGTSKAGIIFSIFKKFKIPIYYLGVGEKLGELIPFNKKEFCSSLIN